MHFMQICHATTHLVSSRKGPPMSACVVHIRHVALTVLIETQAASTPKMVHKELISMDYPFVSGVSGLDRNEPPSMV
ncbi:MAG: hypothetical protein Q9175_001130 [Cornicularia normoerica]